MDILTVGIVAFRSFWKRAGRLTRHWTAWRKWASVDALLVINNERLRDIYSDFNVMNAFGKADDTLSTQPRKPCRIITIRGTINADFNDVKTVIKTVV